MSNIFTFKKIHRAYLDCRKNKRGTANALKFEINLENNLMLLQKELVAKTYAPGKSICFVVEKPVLREIFAADFKDRIVHHLLVNEILKGGERKFIFESFACRKGKGTHKAVESLKSHMRKVSDNFTVEAWYAQLDIAGFFMSIQHARLFEIFSKLVADQNKAEKWKADVLWLGKIIIFNRPTENFVKKGNHLLFEKVPAKKSLFHSSAGVGLPIGNYTSQFFANLYLNELDQYVKRTLKIKHYLRYVDDFIILTKENDKIPEFIEKIQEFLSSNLSLNLHPNKTKIQKIERGIDFLGYFVKPFHTLVRKRVVREFKRKSEEFDLLACDNLQLKKFVAMANSYFGHFNHADSYNLRKHVAQLHLKNFTGSFEVVKGFLYLKLHKCE